MTSLMLRTQHYKDIAHTSYCYMYLFHFPEVVGGLLSLPLVDGVLGSSVGAGKGTGIGGNGAVALLPPIIIVSWNVLINIPCIVDMIR